MPSTGDADHICTRKVYGSFQRDGLGLSVTCGGVNSTSINQKSRDDKTGRAFAPERGRFVLWLPTWASHFECVGVGTRKARAVRFVQRCGQRQRGNGFACLEKGRLEPVRRSARGHSLEAKAADGRSAPGRDMRSPHRCVSERSADAAWL